MADGGYALPDEIRPDNDIYVCVPVPDDRMHRQAFAGAIYSLARWFSWQEDDQNRAAETAAVWFEIFMSVIGQLDDRLTSCGATDGGQPNLTQTEITDLLTAWGYNVASCCPDCGEEMGNPIIKIGGVAYLANLCGCGDTELYPLGNASQVTVGDDGQTSVIPEPDNGGYDFTPVGGAYNECVSAGFIPHMIDQIVNYQGLLVSLVSTTIDIVTQFDEILDAATLAAAWLRGDADLADWAGFTNAAVETAFNDEDLVNNLTADFEDYWEGQPLTRADLKLFVLRMPQFVGVVPVRFMAVSWVKYCRIGQLNEELFKLASACEGESDYTPGGDNPPSGSLQSDGSTLYTLTTGDGTYQIYEYSPGVEIEYGVGPESFWEAPELKANMIGVASHCRPIGSSNDVVWATVMNTKQAANEETVGSGTYYSLAASRADAETALTALTEQDYYRYDGAASTTIVNGGVKCAYSYADGTVMVDKVYIVCEVP